MQGRRSRGCNMANATPTSKRVEEKNIEKAELSSMISSQQFSINQEVKGC